MMATGYDKAEVFVEAGTIGELWVNDQSIVRLKGGLIGSSLVVSNRTGIKELKT